MKESPYLEEACEGFLLSLNINPYDHKEGPADEEIAMCNRLFESHDWETPTGSIFNDTTFLYVCNLVRHDGDVAVKAMIGTLIVPLACVEIVRGRVPFKGLIDSMMMRWEGSGQEEGLITGLDDRQSRLQVPKPDHSIGFSMSASTQAQLDKLKPFLGDGRESSSYFKGVMRMLFPFLTAEAQCEGEGVEEAERKNMHSMGRALSGVVELFKIAKRENNLHRRILGFLVSYNTSETCVNAYYPVVAKKTSTSAVKVSYHRRLIRRVMWAADNDKDRWTIYHFILTLYRD